jgi:hypothetical protein
VKLTRQQYQILKNGFRNNLYLFEKYILGFKDLTPAVHGPLCAFMQNDTWRRKQVTLPRGYLKTSTCTIGKALWLACRNPDVRILIVSNVLENASKMLGLIRSEVESNPRIQMFFPEIIPPSFNKIRWSDRCAEVNRPHKWPEGTWEVIGVSGSVISRHYDHIIEDDLIYAKKDDLTGGELMPDRDDIEKAIGWHKLATSLLIHPGKGVIDNVGTRWAPYDLINYIQKYEKGWKHFGLAITDDATVTGKPTWPERFSEETIQELHKSQGPYMFSTQYLCKPVASSMRVFDKSWLRYYDTLPAGMRYFTTVDLAGWDDTEGRRQAKKSYNVVLTCGIDSRRHLWVARYDRGRYTPTEVVKRVWDHCSAFPVERVGFEVVYYQKAILEECKRFYEKTGHAIPAHALKRDPNITKDARIRGLEPIAAAGGIHIRPEMEELITEYEDYPMAATVDCLDALADQLRIGSPPEDLIIQADQKSPFMLETILEEFERRKATTRYGISNGLDGAFLAGAQDPFGGFN